MKKVINMTNDEALTYFLKNDSYSNIDLPQYFNFQPLLDEIYQKLKGKNINNFYKNKKKNPASSYEKVNYKLYNNKDGKYSWRPLELIHPALYVALVQEICDSNNWKIIINRFKDFAKNKKIICCSIPVESSSKKYDKKSTIQNWWNMYEQRSISLSLDYSYMGVTDISNCYSSIYTHTISWAIHSKEIAKQNKKDKILLGNSIDSLIQEMSFGQTNGIPQGSVLMDFIAEIVLGYADELLTIELEKANIVDYTILRYRDDYRIFSNNTYEIDCILKKITEILASLNLKLNTQKTYITDDIITSSIKKDKMKRIENIIVEDSNLQKQLLIIRKYGIEYPNCGSITVLLNNFYCTKIIPLTKRPHNIEQIISIIVDIMIKSPRTYSIAFAILSKVFSLISKNKKYIIIEKIVKKFSTIPNTEYLNIWLQRITILDNKNKEYPTLLCQKVYSNNNIWNSDWLNFKINESLIIDNEKIKELTDVIPVKEVDKFNVDY